MKAGRLEVVFSNGCWPGLGTFTNISDVTDIGFYTYMYSDARTMHNIGKHFESLGESARIADVGV